MLPDKYFSEILTSPTNISKMSTPKPHQSTARVYDVSVRTSGARNSGVPQNVLVRSLKPIPKHGMRKTQEKYHPMKQSTLLNSTVV